MYGSDMDIRQLTKLSSYDIVVKSVKGVFRCFAFYPQGSFLFETKALSVFASGFERIRTRRISGIQKGVKRAIGQPAGAYKDFSEGKEIDSAGGMPIMVERTSPPRYIVLIPELPPFGN